MIPPPATSGPRATGHDVAIAVVILNFNKREQLLACVRSVLRSSGPSYEVVVVDNHSTDGSAEAVARAFPRVHVVRNPRNLWVGAGRNAGWRDVRQRLRAEYLVFLDNDTVIDPQYLGRLLEAARQDPSAGIVCGKAYMPAPSRRIMSAGMRADLWTGHVYDRGSGEPDRGQYDEAGYVDAGGGFAFMIKSEVMEQLGGFDEQFTPYGWEDVDLCLRARTVGWRTRYVPGAVLYHGGCKISRPPIVAYERSKVKNFILLLTRHATLRQKASCLVCVPLRALQLMGGLLLRGRLDVVAAQWRGACDSLAVLRGLNGYAHGPDEQPRREGGRS